jgi:hypothetical protein
VDIDRSRGFEPDDIDMELPPISPAPPPPPIDPPTERGEPPPRRPQRPAPPGEVPFVMPFLVGGLLVATGLVQLVTMTAGARTGYLGVAIASISMATLFLGPFIAGSFWLKARMAESRWQPPAQGLPTDEEAGHEPGP